MPENRFRDTSLDFDERVSALLAELTTEEKLGLLTTHMNAVPRPRFSGGVPLDGFPGAIRTCRDVRY